MSTWVPRSYLDYFRYLMVGVLVVSAICLVVLTYRWPLIWDAQVMHYINFLMDKGFAPYRDITDINMPGAYLIEGWGMHIFGGGDLGWRVYDFALLGLLGAATVVIALPYDWVAGLFAGVMFALSHASEGPMNSAQRDEVMTVLIMVGYALLFEALRRSKPWMMVLFGLSLGMASSVKPTAAPLGVALLAMAWWNLRKRNEPAASYVWSGVAGAGIAVAIVFAFLFRYHATGAFFQITTRLTAYYAGLNHESFARLLRHTLPRAALLMLPFGILVSLADRDWKNWERWALLLGVAFGGFSYFVQRKGFLYHRYALVAFILLYMAVELSLAMRKQGWVRAVGFAGMAMGALVMVPTYTQRVMLVEPYNGYTESLESDLTRLGGDQLQRKVQCFDLVDGCLNALYHLKLVQNTGSTGDLLLFTQVRTPVVDYYRGLFWNDINRNPPLVVVLSNEWFNNEDSFDKVNEWPQFANYLTENYTLAVSREFEFESHHAYRIYLRKGAALPSLAQGN
jgi:hypothetical protein